MDHLWAWEDVPEPVEAPSHKGRASEEEVLRDFFLVPPRDTRCSIQYPVVAGEGSSYPMEVLAGARPVARSEFECKGPTICLASPLAAAAGPPLGSGRWYWSSGQAETERSRAYLAAALWTVPRSTGNLRLGERPFNQTTRGVLRAAISSGNVVTETQHGRVVCIHEGRPSRDSHQGGDEGRRP